MSSSKIITNPSAKVLEFAKNFAKKAGYKGLDKKFPVILERDSDETFVEPEFINPLHPEIQKRTHVTVYIGWNDGKALGLCRKRVHADD
jgi:hypothetical protein